MSDSELAVRAFADLLLASGALTWASYRKFNDLIDEQPAGSDNREYIALIGLETLTKLAQVALLVRISKKQADTGVAGGRN